MTESEQTISEDKVETVNEQTEKAEDQILNLKKQIADKYVEKLKTQKEGGISSFLIGEGYAIKDYLVSEGFGDKIADGLKGKMMESLFAGVDKTLFADLKIIKQKIDDAKTEAQLTALETEIQGANEDPSAAAPVVAGAGIVTAGVVTAETYDKTKYKSPIESDDAKITSKFGKRKHPVTGKDDHHTGIDIAAEAGTSISSICDGKVLENKKTKLGGNQLAIEGIDGKVYYYLHMQKKSTLNIGESVKMGDEIGVVGSTGRSTGPHLHLTIKENDKPVDPLAVLPEVFDEYSMAA